MGERDRVRGGGGLRWGKGMGKGGGSGCEYRGKRVCFYYVKKVITDPSP